MSGEKFPETEESLDIEGSEFVNDTSSRARNRTVMLTPEITGEVRARLAKDIDPGGGAPQAAPGSFVPGGAPAQPEQPPVGGGFDAPPASFGGQVNPAAAPSAAPGGSGFSAPSGVPAGQPGVTGTYSASAVSGGVFWAKETPVRGFLVAYDQDPNGEIYELRDGRLIVTSEATGSGSYLVVNDDTVSPMHAILKVTRSGTVQVLDQLSENGTTIVKADSGDVEELSGDKGELDHGDSISFGDRSFVLCMIPEVEVE